MKKLSLWLLVVGWGIVANAQNSPQQLRLQDCINIALENNLTIKRSELDVASQEITYKQSRFNQLPNLNVGGNYGSNWGRSIDPTTNLFINQRIGFSGLNGSSNWVIFGGLQTRNTINQASLDLQARNFDLERSKNDILLRVMDAYLNVIFNIEQVEAARFQLQSTREQLTRTNQLVEAGSLPILNRLNLESQLASDELLVVQNENNYSIAMLTLKQLLLIPAGDAIEVVREEVELVDVSALSAASDAVFLIAKNNLPEFKSAELGVKSADLGFKAAQGRRYPTLSINGGFSTNYSTAADRQRPVFDGVEVVEQQIGFLTGNPSQTVSRISEIPRVVEVRPDFPLREQFSEYLSRSISLGVQIPIFNRFQTTAAIQRAKISQRQAEITQQEVNNQVRQNIESAFNDALAASKSYEATQRQVAALEESFRVIQSQYNIGAVNFTDYQVANNNLVRAKSDFIRSKYQYIFRIKILDFYQGKPITF